MLSRRPPKEIDLDDLRVNFIVYEIRRVKIASLAMTGIGFVTLFFLATLAIRGYPRLEWQLIALLAFASFCLAFPLFHKFDLSRGGTGIETRDPVALIQAMQVRTEKASGESFEELRRQIGALSLQLDKLSDQLRAGASAAGSAQDDTNGGTAALPEEERDEPSLQEIQASLPAVSIVDDPQKGRFGGDETSGGRMLSGRVEESALGDKWMKVKLKVTSTNGAPLTGRYAYFFLHDTYQPNVYRVKLDAEAMSVSLEVPAYGAYTVGAVVDRGTTRLELDMAASPNLEAPEEWRSR